MRGDECTWICGSLIEVMCARGKGERTARLCTWRCEASSVLHHCHNSSSTVRDSTHQASMITPKTPSSSALVSAEAAFALEGLALSFFWAFAATDLVAAALRLEGISLEIAQLNRKLLSKSASAMNTSQPIFIKSFLRCSSEGGGRV